MPESHSPSLRTGPDWNDGQKSSEQLLREFVELHSEAAFAELVRRHIPVVYGAALRRCGGNADLAADVSQSVFVDLAWHGADLLR